jgi:hypothetical protein
MAEMRKVAWFIFWRFTIGAVIAGFLSGAIFGLIVGFIGAFTGHAGEVAAISGWGGAILGLIASFFVMNWVLTHAVGRPIGGHELRLVAVARA